MRILDEHNDLLRSELGANPNGDGIYRWTRVGQLTYLSWDGTYDYEASESGLMVPSKHLVQKPMRPDLDERQWILVLWEPNLRTMWYQFGKSLYGTTDVHLAVGVEPWTSYKGLTFTQHVIGTIKELRKKSRADWDAEFDAHDAKRTKDGIEYNKDVIGDAFSAFANVPGSHGHHVEFGGMGESRPFVEEASVCRPAQDHASDADPL